MICEKCGVAFNFKEGSNTSVCEKCASINNNSDKGDKPKPEDKMISLLERISGNIGIITIILVIQFICSLIFAVWISL